jgi:MoxR-like ATPase
MYEGDSILHPGPVPGGDVVSAWEAAVSKRSFVQSNMRTPNAPESALPVLDAAALEREARVARSVWVGSKLKTFYQALVQKFENAGHAELENYLSASQSLADLEERIRVYERRHTPYY